MARNDHKVEADFCHSSFRCVGRGVTFFTPTTAGRTARIARAPDSFRKTC